MMLLNGKLIADQLIANLAKKVGELNARYLKPQLDVVLVGSDPSSVQYIGIKREKAEGIGITVKIHKFPTRVREKTILELIDKLNKDKHATGILVQMPLPAHISREKVVWAIAPEKDVDGFQMRKFMPPAPLAVLEILNHYNINPANKKMLIIGRGFLIGKPLSVLAMRRGAKVTPADSSTPNLDRLTQEAQIIVAATGQPYLVTQEMVKPGQIVIDAGGGFLDGQFAGEVDFEKVSQKVAAITPNPGGVGPLTVAILLQNVVKAATMTKVKHL